jgi:hypothetical protein
MANCIMNAADAYHAPAWLLNSIAVADIGFSGIAGEGALASHDARSR